MRKFVTQFGVAGAVREGDRRTLGNLRGSMLPLRTPFEGGRGRQQPEATAAVSGRKLPLQELSRPPAVPPGCQLPHVATCCHPSLDDL